MPKPMLSAAKKHTRDVDSRLKFKHKLKMVQGTHLVKWDWTETA